jgi:integrase
MPRKARDERLDTRTARLKLAPRREPYWRSIQEGRAIGYRRLAGQKAGSWIARHYDQRSGRRYQALGTADDFLAADGADTLTFGQAQERAREWFDRLSKNDGKTVEPLTVEAAYQHYLADYLARGGKASSYIATTFRAHILPAFGDRLVTELASAELRRWHRELATSAPRLRTAANATSRRTRKLAPKDADGHRARRATANAILTLLKAALNLAYREGRVPSDDAWRRVRPFQKVGAARLRYLTDDEATRLINACNADLRLLITAALLTGCRYQELARLQCGDVDLAAGIVTIRATKGGVPRHVVLTEEAQQFFAQAIAGRAPSVLTLPRSNGEAWGKSHQFRPLREACAVASIYPAASFHILRHTHASRLAMRGVPMAVIAAQLGHSDIKLTQRHYAHLSPGYVADTIRMAFGKLGVFPSSTIARIR